MSRIVKIIIIPTVIVVAAVVSIIVIKKKDSDKKEKIETLEFVQDNFLVESDMDSDQSLLEHLDFEGLYVNYEPKWVVNTFVIDTEDYGQIHAASFNFNTDSCHAAYIINWYKADKTKRIEQMLEKCKKEMLAQYKSSDIETSTTAIIPCEWNGIAAKSYDLTARLGTYIVNRRAVIFRSGQNEFRIEMSSDISRESLDTYFESLERSMKISDIDEL